jgi:hypothetical protein
LDENIASLFIFSLEDPKSRSAHPARTILQPLPIHIQPSLSFHNILWLVVFLQIINKHLFYVRNQERLPTTLSLRERELIFHVPKFIDNNLRQTISIIKRTTHKRKLIYFFIFKQR